MLSSVSFITLGAMENLIKIITKPDNVAIVVMMFMVAFFTWLVFREALRNDRERKRLNGGSGEEAKSDSDKLPSTKRRGEETVHTWPFLARKEFIIAIMVFALLLAWSIILDAPLEEQANPTLTPNPAKAPWYFLGLQEMLVYFDPWIAGVLLPGLIIFGLMAIPYLDINKKGSGYYTFSERKFAIITFCFGFLILWILLIVIGVFMRGPGWLWFWPWQKWDHDKVVADVNVDFSQLIGIGSRTTLGFLIGVGIILIYFAASIILPYLYLKAKQGEFLKTLGITRYILVSLLFWTMMALPIKIILRLAFHVKYIWVTHWFNV